LPVRSVLLTSIILSGITILVGIIVGLGSRVVIGTIGVVVVVVIVLVRQRTRGLTGGTTGVVIQS